MRVARFPGELEAARRAVAIGTFDGVHLGHRAVIEVAKETGLRSTVVTFHPHPRAVLGYEVQLLSRLDRRIELIGELGPDEVLVVEFTPNLSMLGPEQFVRSVLEPLGTRIVVAGEGFRFGRGRQGDLELLRGLGLDVRAVPPVAGVSSSRIRELLHRGEVVAAARLLGRPPEVEGVVVAGDARGGTLGFPTANLAVDRDLLVPAHGIYAGAATIPAPPRTTFVTGSGARKAADAGKAGSDPATKVERFRAAISIGVNPHYRGRERKVEAYLLDFQGDLYGRRIRVELWRRLRDERAFATEAELVEQIARDVEATRAAVEPVR